MKRSNGLSSLKFFTPFFLLLRVQPKRALIIGLSCLIIFLLPGQNRYQRQLIRSLASPIQPLPIAYAEPNPYPQDSFREPPLEITAKAALLVDLDSQTILYEKNPHLRLPPASTTKLMTALIARNIYSLDDILTVPQIQTQGSSMSLVSGETIDVYSLLYGLLINSANDAALVLAATSPLGSDQFVQLMNYQAIYLGLFNTHYVNSTGVDNPNQFTSVTDLARLSSIILKDEVLRNIVTERETTVSDTNQVIKHHLVNTNQLLLQNDNVKGVKTGWTENAGGCLVAYWTRGNRHLLSVILASATEQSRFKETNTLLEWASRNYSWEEVEPPFSIKAFAIAGT